MHFLWLALLNVSQAADCDSDALVAQIEESSARSVAQVFVDLVACDEELGKNSIEPVFSKMMTGGKAHDAVVEALRLSAMNEVSTWLQGLESYERSEVLAQLGEACNTSKPVEAFFVHVQENLTATFWKDRWYRGLSQCRTEAIGSLLKSRVEAGRDGLERSQYFGIVEAFARNQKSGAIELLQKMGTSTEDEEELTYLMSAYADAADIGSKKGMDEKAAELVVNAIVARASTLPPRAIEQARATLLSLGAEQEAAALAQYRWPERKQDGQYSYGVAVVERAECKNGKKYAYLHYTVFQEKGLLWPDEIKPLLSEKLVFEWEINTAERCKGTGEIAIAMPQEPFSNEKASEDWVQEQKDAFKSSTGGLDKIKEMHRDTFTL